MLPSDGDSALSESTVGSVHHAQDDPTAEGTRVIAAQASADLGGLVGWVADVIVALGWPGVALLVALENVFPPIPSEVVLPFAGFVAGRGTGGAGPLGMTLAATLGSVIGAIALYELGRGIGQDRTRSWLARLPLVDVHDVDRAIQWFHDRGDRAVLIGRCVPLVRSLISLPAGAATMPRLRFTLLTALGSLAWNGAWVYGGFILGDRWEQAGQWSSWLDAALVVAAAAMVMRLLWTRRHGRPTRHGH